MESILSRLRNFLLNDDSSETSYSTNSFIGPQSPYNPSPADTLTVRSYLLHLGFPLELALSTISLASYYPLIRGQTCSHIIASASRSPCPENQASVLYTVSDAIPRCRNGERLVLKSVAFKIRSHDQGWGGEWADTGTYNGSWTWFDASILRPIDPDAETCLPKLPFDASPEPNLQLLRGFGYEVVSVVPGAEEVTWRVQCNMCASSKERSYEMEWRKGELSTLGPGMGDGRGFLEALREGDRVAVWARASYPGWANHVKEVGVEVLCVVD